MSYVSSNQMLLLTRACEDLERERQEREEEKERYLGEKLPPLQLSGLSLDELQVRVINLKALFLTAENVPAILTPSLLPPRRIYANSFIQKLTSWMRRDMTVNPK